MWLHTRGHPQTTLAETTFGQTVMSQLWTSHSPSGATRRPGTWHWSDGDEEMHTRSPYRKSHHRSGSGHQRSGSARGVTSARARPISPGSHTAWPRSHRTMPYHSDTTGWELDRAEHYASREPVYDRPMAAHLADPLDEHDSSPGLVHAWEQHHVLSWLYAVGLSDVVANVKAQKLRGEDLLQLTPKNVAQKLSLTDGTTIMRVLEQVRVMDASGRGVMCRRPFLVCPPLDRASLDACAWPWRIASRR